MPDSRASPASRETLINAFESESKFWSEGETSLNQPPVCGKQRRRITFRVRGQVVKVD
jgi:hypothetical protein